MHQCQIEMIRGEVKQIIACFLNNESFPSSLDVKIVFDQKRKRMQPPSLKFEGSLNLGHIVYIVSSIRLRFLTFPFLSRWVLSHSAS